MFPCDSRLPSKLLRASGKDNHRLQITTVGISSSAMTSQIPLYATPANRMEAQWIEFRGIF
jgi:hypothetical protein